MKRLAKKTILVTLFTLIFLILVASHQLVQSLMQSQVSQNQPSPNFTSTPNPVVSPFIPDPKLTDQQRFLATASHQLGIMPLLNSYEYILLRAYGAILINQDQEIKLPKVVLAQAQETKEFQDSLTLQKVDNTKECYLQKSATNALNKARSLEKIPFKSGFSGDCLRSFATNLAFWRKYANNSTLEQVKQGKQTKILGLVAPPGTSQHLWGLAVDLHVSTPTQIQALNQNGWFQTVEHDIPHWTYLGVNEEKLRQFGLQSRAIAGHIYWLTPL